MKITSLLRATLALTIACASIHVYCAEQSTPKRSYSWGDVAVATQKNKAKQSRPSTPPSPLNKLLPCDEVHSEYPYMQTMGKNYVPVDLRSNDDTKRALGIYNAFNAPVQEAQFDEEEYTNLFFASYSPSDSESLLAAEMTPDFSPETLRAIGSKPKKNTKKDRAISAPILSLKNDTRTTAHTWPQTTMMADTWPQATEGKPLSILEFLKEQANQNATREIAQQLAASLRIQ